MKITINLQERIKNANKTYFMLQKFFKNKNLSKKRKLTLKNTTIDKVDVFLILDFRRVLNIVNFL